MDKIGRAPSKKDDGFRPVSLPTSNAGTVNCSLGVNRSFREPNSRETPKKTELGQDGNSSTSVLREDLKTVMSIIRLVKAPRCPISHVLEKRAFWRRTSSHPHPTPRALLAQGSLNSRSDPAFTGEDITNKFKKITDWKRVSTALEEVDTSILNAVPDDIVSNKDIDTAIGAPTNHFGTVVVNCQRKVPVKSTRRSLPADVRELIRIKNAAQRRASAYPTPENRSRARAL
ncbi:hypothetical protein EVAR_80984_1 [Eumeta japonica]|uniref:Uncharacterized protein n=1 Tax=Eumeta variegata TaxID=151549 RepID=A0A4C1WR50_EUMVA|nr:hypothetical protein EVAR_80984_1 [Eumeta japonica]